LAKVQGSEFLLSYQKYELKYKPDSGSKILCKFDKKKIDPVFQQYIFPK